MGIEIERKFLVNYELLSPILPVGEPFKQGYFPTKDLTTVRVRIVKETGYLTIKGPNSGSSRSEFEYQVPHTDAIEMLEQFCSNPIIKTRYKIEFDSHIFEVDIFEGENEGLIVAEVELTSESEEVNLPEWITSEVTNDPRYYNSSLIDNPFCSW